MKKGRRPETMAMFDALTPMLVEGWTPAAMARELKARHLLGHGKRRNWTARSMSDGA